MPEAGLVPSTIDDFPSSFPENDPEFAVVEDNRPEIRGYARPEISSETLWTRQVVAGWIEGELQDKSGSQDEQDGRLDLLFRRCEAFGVDRKEFRILQLFVAQRLRREEQRAARQEALGRVYSVLSQAALQD